MIARIYRGNARGTAHIAIHHTHGNTHIPHRSFVLSHNAGGIATTADFGIVETVDHTDRRVFLDKADKTANIITTADATREHTAVIYLRCPIGIVTDGACIASSTKFNITEYNILHSPAIKIGEQRPVQSADSVIAAIENTRKTTDAGRKAACINVVCHYIHSVGI